MSKNVVQGLGVDTLVGPGGASVPAASLEGKHVFLYFSAHWCGPCRGFTPKLAEIYTKFKADSTKPPFEVVFCSSDRSQQDFDKYFAEMPFLALPYDKRTAKDTLARRAEVKGIPTLALMGDDGDILSNSVRNQVMMDPAGNDFPWLPKNPLEILRSSIVLKGNTSLAFSEAIADVDYLAVYFSAHWCPPCRATTPKLAAVYSKIKSDPGKKFEVLFVSSDQEKGEFESYYAEMPWLALPFGDAAIQELKTSFGVQGIPMLPIINVKAGKVASKNAVTDMASDTDGSGYPFVPMPLPLFSQLKTNASVAQALNSEFCVVLVRPSTAAKAADFKALEQTVNSVAGAEKVRFFLADDEAQGGQAFQQVAKMGGVKPTTTDSLVVMGLHKRKVLQTNFSDSQHAAKTVSTFREENS